MIFNSLAFAGFFIIFFFLYWFVFNRNLKAQNTLILIASCVFYGWFYWRFLLLLAPSTILAYYLGLGIYNTTNVNIKKGLLYTGLLLFAGMLLYFKYTNFFIESINLLALHQRFNTLNIILPLGISFYTFRIISYLLDINNGKFKPVTDFVVFASYVAFFPTIMSGPIDRPKTLIPQLQTVRLFNNDLAIDGLRQILWGLFKKIVIADNCALIANFAFNTPGLHGAILISGAFFYTIQVYADFSGYSDMAIGVSKMAGFNITRNFNYPYFAQNISEFWRKWHMSLTSWLTEYIFTPISINLRDYGNWASVIGIIATFLVSGLWHGPNWTFVVWGFLHGCYFIPLIIKGKMNKKKEIAADKLPSPTELKNILLTFLLVMFTFVLFRSDDLHSALTYYRNIFSLTPSAVAFNFPVWKYAMILIFIFIMISLEWGSRAKQHALENINLKWPVPVRWSLYFFACLFIMVFTGYTQQFIYFKF